MSTDREDPFKPARIKGAEARAAGHALETNPYGDARTMRGAVTFARAWWRAWREGWIEEDKRRGAAATQWGQDPLKPPKP